MDYKIVYVFNGKKWLWRQLMLSIKTLFLRSDVVKDNVVVFYGPPRFDEHIEWLEPRCDIRLVETPLNDPEFVKTRTYPYRGKFYGVAMKLHAYGVETPNMIHLDCDTVIKGNLVEILQWKDYDMAVGKWQDGRGRKIMTKNLEMLGLPYWPLMMDGCVACKNNSHNKFQPIYRDYLIRVLKNEIHPHDNTHMNIHAYNLALAQMRKNGYNVIEMPKSFHKYGRSKYVGHLVHGAFAKKGEVAFFSAKEHKLKEIGI